MERLECLDDISEDLNTRYRLTTRALHASLPFDTGHATLFVPEKGISKTTNDDSSEDENDGQSNKRTKISGEEARQFYEDVLLMPKESRRDESRLKKKAGMKRRKRRDVKPQRKTQEVKEITSLGQLFLCVQEGDFEAIRLALSRGLYDVNTVDNFNWTLLMCAAHAGHMTIVKYLLDQGADWLHHTDRRGNNAADLARTAGHPNIAEFIESHNRTSSNSCSHRQLYPSTAHLDETQTMIEDHIHHSSSNSTTDQTPASFYCEICKMTVELGSSTVSKHTTSTVHQFSCQHKPNVTLYGIPESNRGFQLLLKGGWNPEKGLGPEQQGQQFPVKTVLKQDRLGFGLSGKAKPRVTHFSAHDEAAVKSHRERIGGEKECPPKKKDILKAAERDRRWERRMRRYMNTDYDLPI